MLISLLFAMELLLPKQTIEFCDNLKLYNTKIFENKTFVGENVFFDLISDHKPIIFDINYNKQTLKVLSWNLWTRHRNPNAFKNYAIDNPSCNNPKNLPLINHDKRFQTQSAVIRSFLQENPFSVVALQEVTKESVLKNSLNDLYSNFYIQEFSKCSNCTIFGTSIKSIPIKGYPLYEIAFTAKQKITFANLYLNEGLWLEYIKNSDIPFILAGNFSQELPIIDTEFSKLYLKEGTFFEKAGNGYKILKSDGAIFNGPKKKAKRIISRTDLLRGFTNSFNLTENFLK